MTTLLIALPLFLMLRSLRRGPGQFRVAWQHARAWERACMLLLFVPIPGPFDEVVAAVVIARVLRRVNPTL
jgi:hypothetical protein